MTVVSEIFNSPNFSTEPRWHMTEDASESEKREFEEVVNGTGLRKELYKAYPSMKLPYCKWDGTVEDRGDNLTEEEAKMEKALYMILS